MSVWLLVEEEEDVGNFCRLCSIFLLSFGNCDVYSEGVYMFE